MFGKKSQLNNVFIRIVFRSYLENIKNVLAPALHKP